MWVNPMLCTWRSAGSTVREQTTCEIEFWLVSLLRGKRDRQISSIEQQMLCARQTLAAAEEIISACEQAGVQFMDGTM